MMLLVESAGVFPLLEGEAGFCLFIPPPPDCTRFFLLIFGDALSAAFSRGNSCGKPPVFLRRTGLGIALYAAFRQPGDNFAYC